MSDDFESPPFKIVGTLSCIAVERYEALLAAEAERDALREGLRVLLRHVEDRGYPRVAEDMAPLNVARAALNVARAALAKGGG